MGQLYSTDWHVMLILSQVTVEVNACSRGSQPGRGRLPPSENSPPMFFSRGVASSFKQTGLLISQYWYCSQYYRRYFSSIGASIVNIFHVRYRNEYRRYFCRYFWAIFDTNTFRFWLKVVFALSFFVKKKLRYVGQRSLSSSNRSPCTASHYVMSCT